MNNDTNLYKIKIVGSAANAFMCYLLTFPLPPGLGLIKSETAMDEPVEDVGAEIQS